MTHDRAIEAVAVAVTAFATVTSGAIVMDAGSVLTVVAGIGASAVSGYYAAHVTTSSRLASLEAQIQGLRDEVHRYYKIREPGA